MTVLRVTFDTNTIERIIAPERFAEEAGFTAYQEIRASLEDGRIRGFFSEALVGLDAYRKEEKVEFLGNARFRSEALTTGPASIGISVGAQWGAKPELSQQFLHRLEGMKALGMKGLIGPRRLGDLHPYPGDLVVYEPLQNCDEVVSHADKTAAIDRALSQRGLGRAKVVNLGLQFSQRDGKSGEWWPQGIARVRDNTERKKIREAICEWADGDAIAAHFGYGNDLFCTEDMARNSGVQSAFHPQNRGWLKTEFDIVFVSLTELAEQIRLK
jgi:hypothetical protein